MCMKYVNANVACFDGVIYNGDSLISYNTPFNVMCAKEKSGKIYVASFKVVTQICFRGTNDEAHKANNVLEQNKTIDICIRLTKCDRDPSKQLYLDLDKFSINLDGTNPKRETACFDFLNYTRVTNVPEIELAAGYGKYVIKVLIKESTDEAYFVQSLTSLKITDK